MEVPLAKGYLGVDYRTVLGLHRNVGASTAALSPRDPAWDIWIGALPFLLASQEERSYVRETAPVRRERFDEARSPGENSLDSYLWLRSWTSWHYGAGQPQAEPLELEADVARFRFSRSAGMDPWIPGRISLLPRMTRTATSGVNAVIGIAGRGMLEARSTGVWLNGVQIYSTGAVKKLVAGGTHWAGISSTNTMVYGTYDGVTTGTVTGLSNVTNVAYQKARFWAVDGPNSLREIPALTGTPSEAILFPGASQIIDVDSGAAGVYVMTDEGLTNIYVIGAEADGSLSAPIGVATLPRGERGAFLYGYLGRYLAIGSTRGLRVADSGSEQSLPIGPLIIPMDTAPADVTADGNSLWVTTPSIDIDGDGATMWAGTYRLDLSRVVESNLAYGDTAAARFPYATDQYAESAGTPVSLSTYGGRLSLVLADGQMWTTSATMERVPRGWLETGEISYGTSEAKTWQSLTAEVTGSGTFGMSASTGGPWVPVASTALPAPLSFTAAIDQSSNPPGSFLNVRATLALSQSAGVPPPALESLGLRALPAAKRNRMVVLPLMAFDHEVDRNQTPTGYPGFAYDRVRDLELLEERGLLLEILDTRTSETLTCQLDRVTFQSVTPPDRAKKNWGGILEVVLLVV